jgi:hypothetical protein
MICTQIDNYIEQLCYHELMISWQITLTDGTRVYGDYDRPGFDNPWVRLREHCLSNDVYPAKVELHMFGAVPETFFEDENGLDGIFVVRGVAKDQAMDGSHSQSFQTLTVGLLRDDCSCIDVSKYTWPINNFEQKSTTRVLTKENLSYMIFKNGSKKLQHEEVQKLLNG